LCIFTRGINHFRLPSLLVFFGAINAFSISATLAWQRQFATRSKYPVVKRSHENSSKIDFMNLLGTVIPQLILF
jgi:hypothetical protein